EKRVPQDGRFKLRMPGKTIDFRVSIMPSLHGEDAVIRILDKESISEQFTELRLDILGFPHAELKRFRKYIAEPYAMVPATGPPGFTTVHANSVLDVLGRFLNMGVEAYPFVSALNCVLAQRLVRNICHHCKRPVAVSRLLLEESGLDLALEHSHVFYEGIGCIECGGTGYKGRTAICDLLDLSAHIR